MILAIMQIRFALPDLHAIPTKHNYGKAIIMFGI